MFGFSRFVSICSSVDLFVLFGLMIVIKLFVGILVDIVFSIGVLLCVREIFEIWIIFVFEG